MLPALIATWLPNHDNGGMRQVFFHNPPLIKGGKGGFLRANFDNPQYGFVSLFLFYPLTNFTTVQDGEYPMMFKHP